MTPWVLVLFLATGYRGGAVAVDMPTEAACQEALAKSKQMRSYEDAICLRRDVK